MAEFFQEYGLFLLKTATVVIALIVVMMFIIGSTMRSRMNSDGHIEVRRMNEHFESMKDALAQSTLKPFELKSFAKARKKSEKAKEKQARKDAKLTGRVDLDGEAPSGKGRLFVMNFDGDIRASAVDMLRHEISALLTSATPEDEVLVKLESGGGMVAPYGLAASQLDRIRQAKIPLTVSVDKVAASGGYMMACVASQIIAAPFAMVGSVGVVAQIPNIHRLLKDNKVDVELITAGKYKRTLTVLGENTDEDRQKFKDDMERIHSQFKSHVGSHRPAMDMEQIATGEVWSGQDALDLKLVDRLCTSDEYLMSAIEERDVMEIAYKKPKTLMKKLGAGVETTVDRILLRWLDRLTSNRFFTS